MLVNIEEIRGLHADYLSVSTAFADCRTRMAEKTLESLLNDLEAEMQLKFSDSEFAQYNIWQEENQDHDIITWVELMMGDEDA